MTMATGMRLLGCAATMALVAACSGSGDKSATTTTTADTTTTAAAPAPAPTPAATPAAPATDAPAAAPAPAAATTVSYDEYKAKANAAHGEQVFVQCKTCHVAEKGQNRVGPSLWGVVGRHSGSIEGYAYSAANKNSGITWSEDKLFEYLEAPQKVVPGTKMAFAGLKNPQDRADVIAYLKTKA